jgi:hypothetical protein
VASERGRPQNEWVGDYVMAKGEAAARERNLHELALSNSYTYTLQQPIPTSGSRREQYRPQVNPARQSATSSPNGDDDDDEDDGEESELSNYSPDENVRGYFQNEYRGDPR